MKRRWMVLPALLLALVFTAAQAEGMLFAQPLSLADKIKNVKERNYSLFDADESTGARQIQSRSELMATALLRFSLRMKFPIRISGMVAPAVAAG